MTNDPGWVEASRATLRTLVALGPELACPSMLEPPGPTTVRINGRWAQMCQGVPVSRETFRAATLVATLVGVGVILVALSDSAAPWSNLGQALVSGGVVGGVFVFIESSLARAAELRGRQDNLVQQITMTEKLVGVELDGRVLRDLYLPNKNLTAARLRGTDFSRSVLLFGDLRHADATGAVLVDADLGGSALQRATLANASARGCCFLDADLTSTVLTSCDLRGADLSFSVLRNADLQSADLRGARLASSREGSHLPALSEPCVNLSIHTAPIIQLFCGHGLASCQWAKSLG